MRTEFLIATFVILTIVVSCESTRKNEDNEINSDTNKVLIKSSLTLQKDSMIMSIKPENFLFKYSQCIHECNDYERIISKKHKGDSLFLKIGSIQNCTGKFRLDLKYSNDTLDLDIRIKGNEVKKKNGEVYTIIEWKACDCYYYFNIGIKNIKNEYKTILINGHNFGRKPRVVDTLNEDYLLDTIIRN